MLLRTKVQSLTFDGVELGATASLTRILTEEAIGVLALVTGDASALPIESDGDEVRRDTNEIQAVGAEAFLSTVLGTQMPGPGMKIIEQERVRAPGGHDFPGVLLSRQKNRGIGFELGVKVLSN